MLKKLKLLILGLAATGLLVACGSKPVEEPGKDKAQEQLLIQHDLGELSLDRLPEKVVVFDYASLDSMKSLGLEDKVIGLPKKSLPAYLDEFSGPAYEDVGSLQEANFEKIYQMKPDLIIIADRQAKQYEEFAELAPTLYLSTMDGNYMDLLKNNLNQLGQVFQVNVDEKLDALVAKVEELKGMAKENPGKGLFLMANDGELKGYGPGSRFGVIYDDFGIDPVDPNIEESTHGSKLSFEYLLEKDPDYLYIMDRTDIAGGDIKARDTMENDLMKTTKAYKNSKIIYVNSPVWYVSSGGIMSTEFMIEDVMESFK